MTTRFSFEKLLFISALCAASFLLGYKAAPDQTLVVRVNGIAGGGSIGGSGGVYNKEEKIIHCLGGSGANDKEHSVSINDYCGLK